MLQLGKLGRKTVNSFKQRKFGGLGNSKPYFSEAGPAPNYKPLIINEDGELNEYYLPGATILDSGMTVQYDPPYRYYLMRNPTTDYENADNFYKPDFAGKTFTVDIDYKKDGASCGCNLNFYLVDMPVADAGKDGDYYCDAQCFEGMGCCPEFDMMEGNNEVNQVTNHACTDDYTDHPDWECNKWGDPEVKTSITDFGPSSSATIDTSKAFTYSQRFDENGGDFIFTTTMSQEGRTVTQVMGPGNEQLNSMLKVIQNGMAFVTGYWFAPDMNWLDGTECGNGEETCNKNPAYISNWRITTNTDTPTVAPTPTAAPTPTVAPTPDDDYDGGGGSNGVGKCCWGDGCTACDTEGYCVASQANCEGSCAGQWC